MFANLLGTIIIPAAVIAVVILLMVRNKSVEYQCGHCGEIFQLPPLTSVVVPHMMGKKYVKCPKCGLISWVSPRR